MEEENDYAAQIVGFLEEFIVSTGTIPLFVSFNNGTYEKIRSQTQTKSPKLNSLVSIGGITILISPSLKDGVIVFIGGDGFLNRCYQVSNRKVQPSNPELTINLGR